MKRHMLNTLTIVSTVLLGAVLVLGAVSYWRSVYVAHRDTSWTTEKCENHAALTRFSQGRVLLMTSHFSERTDLFLPENWTKLSPDAKQRLLAFKAHFDDFHGFQSGSDTLFPRDIGQ